MGQCLERSSPKKFHGMSETPHPSAGLGVGAGEEGVSAGVWAGVSAGLGPEVGDISGGSGKQPAPPNADPPSTPPPPIDCPAAHPWLVGGIALLVNTVISSGVGAAAEKGDGKMGFRG